MNNLAKEVIIYKTIRQNFISFDQIIKPEKHIQAIFMDSNKILAFLTYFIVFLQLFYANVQHAT